MQGHKASGMNDTVKNQPCNLITCKSEQKTRFKC